MKSATILPVKSRLFCKHAYSFLSLKQSILKSWGNNNTPSLSNLSLSEQKPVLPYITLQLLFSLQLHLINLPFSTPHLITMVTYHLLSRRRGRVPNHSTFNVSPYFITLFLSFFLCSCQSREPF